MPISTHLSLGLLRPCSQNYTALDGLLLRRVRDYGLGFRIQRMVQKEREAERMEQ
jgi:hypothetical protein